MFLEIKALEMNVLKCQYLSYVVTIFKPVVNDKRVKKKYGCKNKQ